MPPEVWPLDRRPRGDTTMADLAADVALMNKLAQCRRAKRYEAGAVQLERVKLHFRLDRETQEPLEMTQYPLRDSNRMIEEYMLLANYLVAMETAHQFPAVALLRNHPEPEDRKVQASVELVRQLLDPTFSWGSSADLHANMMRLRERVRGTFTNPGDATL